MAVAAPDDVIDLDLLRRSEASARHAAGEAKGGGAGWVKMALRGWRVIPVRIVADGELADEDVLVQPEIKPRAPRAAPAEVPREVRVPARGRFPALLRCRP